MECSPLSENPLSLPLQIHHVNVRQAPSPAQVILLLLVTTQIYRLSDYKPHCPFHGAQYLGDLLREYHQLPLEFITQKSLIQSFK